MAPSRPLAHANTLAGIERHLDAALVDLEEEIAATPNDDPGTTISAVALVAVRDAERAVARITTQGESVLDGLGEAHDVLHEAFPVDE